MELPKFVSYDEWNARKEETKRRELSGIQVVNPTPLRRLED